MARFPSALSLLVLCLALAPSAAAAPPTVTIAVLMDGDPVRLTTSVAGSITGTAPVTVTLRVDDGAETPATVVNQGYLGSVTLPSEGAHTITVTATNAEGSASVSVVLVGDATGPTVNVIAPVTGFETGDRTVDMVVTVSDAHLDPDDPNTLRVNGASIPVDPNDPTTFIGKAPIAVGERALSVVARDRVGNTTTITGTVFVTRTTVCVDPAAPATNNNDPNLPHLIVVDRLDDLPLPPSFDPNANPSTACDIRPDVHLDDPNDGSTPFRPPVGRCTLRGALQIANAHPGPDVIRLPGNIVRLSRRGEGDDRGDLDVTDDLTVLGQGRDVSAIDARKLRDRVFDVAPGVSFAISAATVRGGQTPKKSQESGGCLRIVGPRNTEPDDPNDPNDLEPSFAANNLAILDCKSGSDGGGLAFELQGPDDFATMTCGIVARSSAKGDGGGILLDGGALTLRNSTIAFASSGALGGGLADRDGSLVMTNATLSGNKARLAGGGLALADGADATLNNVTFAKNKAKRGRSVSTSDASGGANELDVSNSILGDKPKATCDGPLTSLGGNLDPGESCGLGAAQDLENANPKLEKLATNVGIPTHALESDSPAIDQGIFATCEPLDERNADRVDGPPDPVDPPNPDQCDSGAFEFASSAPQPEEKETPAP